MISLSVASGTMDEPVFRCHAVRGGVATMMSHALGNAVRARGLFAVCRSRCRIGYEYPVRIVDHQTARREYLDLAKRWASR